VIVYGRGRYQDTRRETTLAQLVDSSYVSTLSGGTMEYINDLHMEVTICLFQQ
jgi:hypothetical protein